MKVLLAGGFIILSFGAWIAVEQAQRGLETDITKPAVGYKEYIFAILTLLVFGFTGSTLIYMGLS